MKAAKYLSQFDFMVRLLPQDFYRIWINCPKNDVISFSWKGFLKSFVLSELGLRLGLELAEIYLNTFLVKRLFGQVF